MSNYWLGFITLPALALAAYLVIFAMQLAMTPPRWTAHTCICREYKQIRSRHPRRPWWVWRVLEWWQHRRHDRHRHAQLVAAWHAGGIGALNEARRDR